jgi:pimeloyl-ACP methyl ester carboxylesterase
MAATDAVEYMATYVLVHGAWHSGKELDAVAALLRSAGHAAFTPTIRGNGLEDPKTVGLDEAIRSIEAYLVDNCGGDVILVGHSFGGMIITAIADRLRDRVRRLIYWNAFVPNDGECVYDMLPSGYIALFQEIVARRGDGAVMLPFSIWREAFINDADLDTAKRAYECLNPHPMRTLSDRISLTTNPNEMHVPKSYINCTEDTSLPPDYAWHPHLSRRLGLFRLIQVPGSHELCFSDPSRLARAILDAGRD